MAIKKWRSVRVRPEERTRTLPGDELIKEPIGSLHHAITIRRPRHEVWPWLAQMGAGVANHFHRLPWWAAKRIVAAIHFIMQRKQLLGIARRVEQGANIETCGSYAALQNRENSP